MSERWTLLRLQHNDLELVILPGIGGRLWDVVFQGRSLIFQNSDLVELPFSEIDLAGLPTRSPQFGFPLWGGEKTWIAPDTGWVNGAPFPTLDSGPYQITSRGAKHVELTSQICPLSHLSVTRRITLISPSSWRITHSVTNHGVVPCVTGIWSVMMIDTPAKIAVAMNDPTIHPVFGHAGTLVAQSRKGVIADCNTEQEFKVALANPLGEALIKIGKDGPWLMCCTPAPSRNDVFAHQHPFEIFNSGDYPYCEAEWHSPTSDLAPDQSMHYCQDFEIRPHNDPSNVKSYKELLTCMS